MVERRAGKRYNCKGFSLNDIYLAKVEELAELLGCSDSEVIRRAIDHYYLHILQELSKIDSKRFNFGNVGKASKFL